MFDFVQQTWFVIGFFTFPWFLFNLLCKWFHGFLRAVCQSDVKQDFVVVSLRFLLVFRLRTKGRSIFSHFRTFFLSRIFRNQILSVKKFIHYDIFNMGLSETMVLKECKIFRVSPWLNQRDAQKIQFIFIFNREWQPIRFHVKNQ